MSKALKTNKKTCWGIFLYRECFLRNSLVMISPGTKLMWNFQTGLLMDREIKVSVGWCSVSAQSLLWPNQVPVHIIHYSKSLLSSWVCIPLYYIIRVRNTLFCTEKVFVIHLLKIWFYHSIMKTNQRVLGIVTWSDEKCAFTVITWTEHYPDKSWNFANSVENLWLILAKAAPDFWDTGFQLFQDSICASHCSLVLPFPFPHETGMHCCSIISPTETLCRLHYFLKVKHKVAWIKIECDMLWLSIFPVKIHSFTKWTENFSATIYILIVKLNN